MGKCKFGWACTVKTVSSELLLGALWIAKGANFLHASR